MIIGSGLLASALNPYFGGSSEVCVYAAGVSNSGCVDQVEFDRELQLLTKSIDRCSRSELFVYFSTCSVQDPCACISAYVQHKLRMEKIVSQHEHPLIVRLPQVAGHTSNPHILLNHLYTKISRSEKLIVWKNSRRNIIDVQDAARIVSSLINDRKDYPSCVNVANSKDISVPKLVKIMEEVVGKKAVCEFLDYGGGYQIDTEFIRETIMRCGISFDVNYTKRVVSKYYGRGTRTHMVLE